MRQALVLAHGHMAAHAPDGNSNGNHRTETEKERNRAKKGNHGFDAAGMTFRQALWCAVRGGDVRDDVVGTD